VIAFAGVGKRYRGDAWAVHDVSFELAAGEFVAILGESGSGKTTLLKMVNRLIEPTEGTITVDGKSVRETDPVELRRTIGYVIQHIGLLPHLTIAANVAMVPTLLGWDEPAITARVTELLALVGLPDIAMRYPDQLSGGQRQRIGVARALAARSKIMLLDEPFGGLDPITRATLQAELKKIHAELALTTVMVTHDMVEALTLADRIAIVFRGALKQIATPRELLQHPADPYVEQLMGMARRQAEQLASISA
jgi:osmoprotectant transport system ATP-binding protein